MWKVEYTKRFLKDIAALPVEIQTRVKSIVFQEFDQKIHLIEDILKK